MADIVEIPVEEIEAQLGKDAPAQAISPFAIGLEPRWGFTTEDMIIAMCRISNKMGVSVYGVVPVNAKDVVNTSDTYYAAGVYYGTSIQISFEPGEWPNVSGAMQKLDETRIQILSDYHFRNANFDVKN